MDEKIKQELNSAKDWFEALESLAQNHPEIEDKEKVKIVMDYFYPKEDLSQNLL